MTQVAPALLRYLDLMEKRGKPSGRRTPEIEAILSILDDILIEHRDLKSRLYRLETRGEEA